MHPLRPSILLSAILYATQVSLALHIDHSRRSEDSLPNLLTRAPNATSGLDITGGSYYINITLGGKHFSVMIDTGR
jgi:predicted aspartyl protease